MENYILKDITDDRAQACDLLKTLFNIRSDDNSELAKQLLELLAIPEDDVIKLCDGTADPSPALVRAIENHFDHNRDLALSFGINKYLVMPFSNSRV